MVHTYHTKILYMLEILCNKKGNRTHWLNSWYKPHTKVSYQHYHPHKQQQTQT